MKEQRLQRVIEYMEQADLEQIVISSPASVYYLTGYWVEPHERMLALYLDRWGKVILFANSIFGLNDTPEIPLVCHGDSEHPLPICKSGRPGQLGIDKFWYSKFLIGLMELRRDMVPVVGSHPVVGPPAKGQHRAGKAAGKLLINDKVMASAIALLREGVTENGWLRQPVFLQHSAGGGAPSWSALSRRR